NHPRKPNPNAFEWRGTKPAPPAPADPYLPRRNFRQNLHLQRSRSMSCSSSSPLSTLSSSSTPSLSSSSAYTTSTAYEQSPHPHLYQSGRSTSVPSSPIISDAAPRKKSNSSAPESRRVSFGDITVISFRSGEAPSSPAGSVVSLTVDDDARDSALRVGEGLLATSAAGANDGEEEPEELWEGDAEEGSGAKPGGRRASLSRLFQFVTRTS
ncbi:hypothetical protein HK097_006970, partial [Rhizophlyctis rosea]